MVVHSMSESLFTPQVFFGRLDGYMTKQELYLFKFTP
jgi:hypothetical protein